MMRLSIQGLLVLLAAGGLGCAALGPGASSPEAEEPEVLARPDAPADYDVLVAQQLALEGRAEDAVAAYERAVAKDPDSAYLRRRLAGGLAQQGRLDESLEHAKRAIELDSEDEAARVFLAQLHRVRREPAFAETLLVDPAGEPLNADAALLLYQIRLEAGRLEEALAVAHWLVREEPDELRGRIALASVYQELGRPDEAEASLRQALEIDPGNLRIYGALARSLRERGDNKREIALYAEILERYPNHHSTLVALGEAQMALDDLQGAITTFQLVVDRYPEDVQSLKNLGYLRFEARQFREAEDLFRRAVESGPGEFEAAFFLGVVRRRIGEGDAALEAFEMIPPDHAHFAEARTQIAAIYERRGLYERALVELERASKLDPSRDVDLYAANLRGKSGDFDGAVSHMERLLAEHPDDDELLFNLGVIYGEAKRIEEAIGFMQRALERNPENASALNYIGYTWAERGIRLDEAEGMITRAIELRPDDGFIVDSLGWVYYMRARPLVQSGRSGEAQGFLERALVELERADELTGGDPVISEHLGDTYLLLDQKQLALEHFEEALSLEPREGEQPLLLQKFENLRQELH
ncbi:MAG: tetratricopeptide repeat protein [Myxococcales bacterium]|nr:MAG: tetratricopeptide repeat protein [Myxococcales bacterium]